MSHSSSLWMTPRNGDVNCEACTDRPPCMNHDLTFGANFDTYSRAINISRIALTEIISLTNTKIPTTENVATTQITATKTMATATITTESMSSEAQNTTTKVPTDQALELIATRLQDKVIFQR